MNKGWSRGDRIAFWSLTVAFVGVVLTAATVPEVRRCLGLDTGGCHFFGSSQQQSFENFMKQHYELLNQRAYNEAWRNFSDNYKNVCYRESKQDWIDFWNKYDGITITGLKVVGKPNGKPVVDVSLSFLKDGKSINEKHRFQLVRSENSSGWLIDANSNCVVW